MKKRVSSNWVLFLHRKDDKGKGGEDMKASIEELKASMGRAGYINRGWNQYFGNNGELMHHYFPIEESIDRIVTFENDWRRIIAASSGFGFYVTPEIAEIEQTFKLCAVRLLRIRYVEQSLKMSHKQLAMLQKNYWVTLQNPKGIAWLNQFESAVKTLELVIKEMDDIMNNQAYVTVTHPSGLMKAYVAAEEVIGSLIVEMSSVNVFKQDELKDGRAFFAGK